MKYRNYEEGYEALDKRRSGKGDKKKEERRAARLLRDREALDETALCNDVLTERERNFEEYLASLIDGVIPVKKTKTKRIKSIALTDNPLPVKETVFYAAPVKVVSKDRIGLDMRNQLFTVGSKNFGEYVDEEGTLVPAHSRTVIENAIGLYRFYIVMRDGKLYPVMELEKDVTYNRVEEFQGILTREKVNLDNPKKPGTLLYRLLKDFNLKAEDLRLGFYDGRPGFYYAEGSKFIYINVVKGKSFGYVKDWVTVYV